ncbi:hypothetical protein Pgin04_01578 [Porphyromonas gingivalis]
MGDKITIYIQTVYDKYIDRLRFVYKSFSIYMRPLQNKEVEGRGVLGIKGASERGGSKE